jgi:hypothetical protein
MELIKYFSILVIALAVIHGAVSAFQPSKRTAPAGNAVTPPSTDEPTEEDDHLGALESMARMEHGLMGAPKGVQVWALYDDD